MKLIYSLLFLLLIGCGSDKTEKIVENETDTKFDSIINKSQENITLVAGASRKSDSTITGKVEKTVKKIAKMEKEIKQLKEENNELKKILYDIDNDRGQPYIIRTISDNEDY